MVTTVTIVRRVSSTSFGAMLFWSVSILCYCPKNIILQNFKKNLNLLLYFVVATFARTTFRTRHKFLTWKHYFWALSDDRNNLILQSPTFVISLPGWCAADRSSLCTIPCADGPGETAYICIFVLPYIRQSTWMHSITSVQLPVLHLTYSL